MNQLNHEEAKEVMSMMLADKVTDIMAHLGSVLIAYAILKTPSPIEAMDYYSKNLDLVKQHMEKTGKAIITEKFNSSKQDLPNVLDSIIEKTLVIPLSDILKE